MKKYYCVIERVIKVADYIIATKCTVREATPKFGVSKSTVHKDVTTRLKGINRAKWQEVNEVLQKNKAERHIRGGMATKIKFEKLKKKH